MTKNTFLKRVGVFCGRLLSVDAVLRHSPKPVVPEAILEESMSRLSLKSLLMTLGIASVIGASLTLALLYMQQNRMLGYLQNVSTVDGPLLYHLQDVYAQGLQTEQATRNVILNPADQKARDNYASADKQFREALAAASTLAKDSMAVTLHGLLPQWDASHVLKRKLMDLAAAGDTAKAVQLLNTDETPLWREIKKTVLAAIATQHDVSKANLDAIQEGEQSVFQMFLAMAVVSVILLMALIVWLIRGVTSGAEALITYARTIATGNFTTTPRTGLPLEFEAIGGSLLDMVRHLEDSLGYYQGIVAGMATPFVVVDTTENLQLTNDSLMALIEQSGRPEDYYNRNVAGFFYNDPGRKTVLGQAMAEDRQIRKEVELVSHKGNKRNVLIDATVLYNAINGKMMGALCVYSDYTELRRSEATMREQTGRMLETAQEAKAIADTLAQETEALARQVDSVEHGASAQKERIGEMALAMDAMNSAVLEVARNAAAAASLADAARGKATAGADMVAEVVQSIRNVNQLAEELRRDMDDLGSQAEGIGKIMGVIADIADQTNLLALNAAIEAARAGDAGRGFAVVADEVRKLAEKTMTATKDVAGFITTMQQSVRKNSAKTDETSRAIAAGTDKANASGNMLQEIVGIVSRTSDQIRSMAAAAEEQSATTEQIRQSAEEISRISHETSDAMATSARAVTALAGQARDLEIVISGLEGGQPALPA
jgi:methyl-accepting chemotaxis protein